MKVSGLPREKIALCASTNAKYHFKKALDAIGQSFENLPPFVHPVIPEPHDLFLIVELSPHFWESGKFKYQKYLYSAEYLGMPILKTRKIA